MKWPLALLAVLLTFEGYTCRIDQAPTGGKIRYSARLSHTPRTSTMIIKNAAGRQVKTFDIKQAGEAYPAWFVELPSTIKMTDQDMAAFCFSLTGKTPPKLIKKEVL